MRRNYILPNPTFTDKMSKNRHLNTKISGSTHQFGCARVLTCSDESQFTKSSYCAQKVSIPCLFLKKVCLKRQSKHSHYLLYRKFVNCKVTKEKGLTDYK